MSVEEQSIFDEESFTAQCPECAGYFKIEPKHLNVRACESAGIYTVELHCPLCKHYCDLQEY